MVKGTGPPPANPQPPPPPANPPPPAPPANPPSPPPTPPPSVRTGYPTILRYRVPKAIRELIEEYKRKQTLKGLNATELNAQDAWGKTALHRAVENGQFEAVKIVLENKAQSDLPDNLRPSALDVARIRCDKYAGQLNYKDLFWNNGVTAYRWKEGTNCRASLWLS